MADVKSETPLYGDPEYFADQLMGIIDLDYSENFVKGLEIVLLEMITYHVSQGKHANYIRERICSPHRMPEMREQ